jgi:predicted nucleotidyltransferase
LLAEYRKLLEKRFGSRLLKLRLFGSRARGDNEPDSDVDVAVVIQGLIDAERAEVIDLAFTAWRTVGEAPLIQVLAWSDTDESDRVAAERRIAFDIETEGIPV